MAPAPSGGDALAVAAVADGSNVTAGGEVGAVTGLEQVTIAQRFSKDGGTCRLPVVYKCALGVRFGEAFGLPPRSPACCGPQAVSQSRGRHAGACCWTDCQAVC